MKAENEECFEKIEGDNHIRGDMVNLVVDSNNLKTSRRSKRSYNISTQDHSVIVSSEMKKRSIEIKQKLSAVSSLLQLSAYKNEHKTMNSSFE